MMGDVEVEFLNCDSQNGRFVKSSSGLQFERVRRESTVQIHKVGCHPSYVRILGCYVPHYILEFILLICTFMLQCTTLTDVIIHSFDNSFDSL